MPRAGSITNLEKSDFIVEEDGVAQPITQFTKERVPVSLSLTLDISDSMRGQRMADARAALAHFLDELLAVDDEASLLGFNHETRMFGQWTTERAGMRAKLDAIRPSGGTAMYDAIDAALPLFESRQHPRAAILLVSDGADTASDVTPTALKQKLVRSDVFLYAIGIDSARCAQFDAHQSVHAQRADQPGRRLHRDHRQHRGARPRHRTDRRRAESPIHDRLHADDARRRQVPHVRVRVTNDTYSVRARRGVIR